MPGHGPPPKDPSERARRNRESTAGVIEADAARKPNLGAKRPDGAAWNPATVTAWNTWWGSPLAGRWIDAFVPGLRLLAWLLDDVYAATDPARRRELMAEVRMSGREFGLSLMGLRSLGVTLKRPTPEAQRARPSAPTLRPGADPRGVLSLETERKRRGA